MKSFVFLLMIIKAINLIPCQFVNMDGKGVPCADVAAVSSYRDVQGTFAIVGLFRQIAFLVQGVLLGLFSYGYASQHYFRINWKMIRPNAW